MSEGYGRGASASLSCVQAYSDFTYTLYALVNNGKLRELWTEANIDAVHAKVGEQDKLQLRSCRLPLAQTSHVHRCLQSIPSHRPLHLWILVMSGPYIRSRSPEPRSTNGLSHGSASSYSRYPPATGAGTSNGNAARAPWPAADTPTSPYFPNGAYPPDARSPEDRFAYSTTLRRQATLGTEGFNELMSSPTHVLRDEGAAGVWSRVRGALASVAPVAAPSPARSGSKEPPRETASARFAHATIEVSDFPALMDPAATDSPARSSQDTLAHFHTSLTHGLTGAIVPQLRTQHGSNEFAVAAPEPALLKFAKTIYESPLILLLCGSAAISALMGNIDDAVSITIAVLIVLTGKQAIL
jgi:hypothetical protein